MRARALDDQVPRLAGGGEEAVDPVVEAIDRGDARAVEAVLPAAPAGANAVAAVEERSQRPPQPGGETLGAGPGLGELAAAQRQDQRVDLVAEAAGAELHRAVDHGRTLPVGDGEVVAGRHRALPEGDRGARHLLPPPFGPHRVIDELNAQALAPAQSDAIAHRRVGGDQRRARLAEDGGADRGRARRLPAQVSRRLYAGRDRGPASEGEREQLDHARQVGVGELAVLDHAELNVVR